jgi:hypothetical protein
MRTLRLGGRGGTPAFVKGFLALPVRGGDLSEMQNWSVFGLA